MAGYNKITLVGNVGNDPQLKVFEQSKVAEFSLALNESYTDRNGQKQEKTDWFRIGVWGNRADVIMQYVKRGNQIMVEGKLVVRTYQDPTTGKDRFSMEVRASDFVLLTQPERAEIPPAGARPSEVGTHSTPASAYDTPTGMPAGEKDDLPF